LSEGPSLVILRALTKSFAGARIRTAQGDPKIDKARLRGQRIVALRTWGKHFLIELGGFSVRIHFLMFGSHCINERKDRPARLSLGFSRRRELNFYSCAVSYIERQLDEEYDWRADVIKNEVLFRIRMHPLSKLGALPAHKLRALVEQARQYSFDFLEWKKAFVLREHWLVHTKRSCPRCNVRLTKAYLGTLPGLIRVRDGA
jgi:endonuclease VIII